jgi:hypothetical protein
MPPPTRAVFTCDRSGNFRLGCPYVGLECWNQPGRCVITKDACNVANQRARCLGTSASRSLAQLHDSI